MKYQLIASGTFDFLHKGHKSFLQKSLEISDEVIVCITSDSYIRSFKNPNEIEDFEVRKRNVGEFLESIGALDKTVIISIDDVYGPLLTNKYNPNAIAVTPETENGAKIINKKREGLGLPELKIEVIEMQKAEDGGVISSSRIRNGEINREGRLYINPVWGNKTFILPESLRSELQRPFGKILNSILSGLNPLKTITIGDVTTQKFNENKIGQFLSIVDFTVKRERKFDKLSQLGFESRIKTKIVKNPAGSVSHDLLEIIKKAFENKERQVILIEGEEDLAVLPAILTAPLGFSIFYGQPDQGLVEVLIDEQTKEKAYNLLSKFKLS